jgi:class 3 adenylate cyclase
MPDHDNILTETQLEALMAARYSLVATIEELIGGDQDQVVRLVFIAVSALFADMLALSATLRARDAELVAVVNQQLAKSGWRVVPIPRH